MRQVCLVIAALVLALGLRSQAAERLGGGNGTLYLGTFGNQILILDEATERVAGRVATRTGIPRRMSLSHDRKRFYVMNVNMEEVEVVDIAQRQVRDTFKLSEGDKKVRIMSFEADPANRRTSAPTPR